MNNEFEYKKTKNHCNLEDRFQKKVISVLHIRKIADKKTAYNRAVCNPFGSWSSD